MFVSSNIIMRYLLAAVLTVTAVEAAVCLTQSQANTIANAFGSLISSYNNSTANALLASSFVDYSESINSLKNNGCTGPNNLLGTALSSKSDFETESAAQPAVPFSVQNVFVACNVITVRWLSNQSPQPVVGISILQTQLALTSKYGFQINEIWAEFDSAAWLVNLGIFKPTCSGSKREVEFTA